MLPEFRKIIDKIYFKGHILTESHEIVIYIYEFSTHCSDVLDELRSDQDVIYGLIGAHKHKPKAIKAWQSSNCILLEQQNTPKVIELFINGCKVDIQNCIITLYDYHSVKSSETINETADFMCKLQCLMQNEQKEAQSSEKGNQGLSSTSFYWVSSFMFAQHVINYSKLICWLFSSMRRDKRVKFHYNINFFFGMLPSVLFV